MTITIDIPATFNHASAIYDARKVNPDPQPRYGIALPGIVPEFANCNIRTHNGRGESYGVPIVHASSTKAPVIMIGDGSLTDEHAWSALIDKARRYRVPLDTLLIDRPLKVACHLWTPNGPHATGKEAINLIGVQILGDLTKSPLLDERIAEIKAWFSEGDD